MRKRDGHFVKFCTLTPFPRAPSPSLRALAGAKEFAFGVEAVKGAGGQTGGGEKGVAGEKGTEEVSRCVSGRCFGKNNPQSAPVHG